MLFINQCQDKFNNVIKINIIHIKFYNNKKIKNTYHKTQTMSAKLQINVQRKQLSQQIHTLHNF